MGADSTLLANANQDLAPAARADRMADGITPLPLGFSQVFILKGVKVICFETLIQVLILKGLRVADG
jgi:hypothetical protein